LTWYPFHIYSKKIGCVSIYFEAFWKFVEFQSFLNKAYCLNGFRLVGLDLKKEFQSFLNKAYCLNTIFLGAY